MNHSVCFNNKPGRDPSEFGKKHQRDKRQLAEKESPKWLTSLQSVATIQKETVNTQLISVGDSEADLHALFDEAQRLNQHFLIRAGRDRLIEDQTEKHLWEYMAKQPVAGTLEVAMPRQADRPARTATLSIRFVEVVLRVPFRYVNQGLSKITAWAVIAQEETPPTESDPIAWNLLTNVPTQNLTQAIERVHWYSCRWVVEMFHRILKSGCRIEHRQFDDLNNLKRFLAIDSVVAWRVLYLTLISRTSPQRSCASLLEVYEWQALYCFIHKTNQPPAQPPTLGDAALWIAKLGGFTGSKNIQPGTTVFWKGLQRLTDIAQAWLVFHPDT